MKDVASYLQKMVATPDLVPQFEKQKQEQTKKSQLKQADIDSKTQLADKEQQKDKFKTDYFEKKKQLAIDLLKANSEIYLNLMNQLALDSKDDKPNLLAELAYKNFKQDNRFMTNSFDEFLFNFSQEGIFQSYIFEQMSIIFPDFQSLKSLFLPQALALGIKEVELF